MSDDRIDMERSELVSRYLNRKMSSEEVAEFHLRMLQDDDLYQEVVFQRETISLLKESADEIFPQYATDNHQTVPKQQLEVSSETQASGGYPSHVTEGKNSRLNRLRQFLTPQGEKPFYQRPEVLAIALVFVICMAMLLPFILPPAQFLSRAERIIAEDYSETLPLSYEHDAASRGISEESLGKMLKSRFVRAMEAYIEKDYATAVFQMNRVAGHFQFLADAEDDSLKTLARNFYLYRGLSFLALSRQSKDRSNARTQIKQAQFNLEKALQLARIQKVKNLSTFYYFHGLASGLQGDSDTGVESLRRVATDSPFYDKSILLIDIWDK